MLVVAINGSPKAGGNTATAIATVAGVLETEGIQVELVNIGTEKLHGCAGCGACREAKNRQCRFDDDSANTWMQTMFKADGIILASPVYYAGINGALKSFLDRAFYVATANGALFRHKAGAGIVALRRAGSLTALGQLISYLTVSEMYLPSGNYWNMMYGRLPEEAAKDEEGRRALEVLGANMAWLLKLLRLGKEAVPPPARQAKVMMNFIR